LEWDKAPHVCFKEEFPSSSKAKQEIAGDLEKHLRARFASVKDISLPLVGPRIIDLQLGQKTVSLVWHKSRFKDGGWILIVAPGEIPSPWDLLRGRGTELCMGEVKLVSREIHALLTSVSGISDVMWYFERFREQGKKAVWTPDELPWTES